MYLEKAIERKNKGLPALTRKGYDTLQEMIRLREKVKIIRVYYSNSANNHNPTVFLTGKIDIENKLADKQLQFIKGELTLEEQNKLFENQTPDMILTIFMSDLKKLIEVIKLENVVESHKAVTDILAVEQDEKKVEKKLIRNFEKGD